MASRWLLAEFAGPEGLERAFEALQRAGYTRLSTWTPYPSKRLVEKLPESIVAWVMLAAGLLGGGFGYLLQWWVNVRAYRIDVGGRPLHAAPAFIPITFESAVLAAGLAGFFTLLWACRLPRLHHPLFEVEGFERASVDRFWLGVDASDPRFDARVADELTALGALRCEREEGRS
jgi:hypothetical protein